MLLFKLLSRPVKSGQYATALFSSVINCFKIRYFVRRKSLVNDLQIDSLTIGYGSAFNDVHLLGTGSNQSSNFGLFTFLQKFRSSVHGQYANIAFAKTRCKCFLILFDQKMPLLKCLYSASS